MRDHDRDSRRLLAAGACLLATILLYAPLVPLAWAARVLDCCAGNYCPIAQHHHRKAPSHDADCGHNMADTNDASECSMSACQDTDRPFTASLVFVLPLPPFTGSVVVTAASDAGAASELLVPLTPLSPPPRLA